MFLEQFLSCGSYCCVLGLVNKIVFTKFVCHIWYFATCYIWYTAEPGCMVEKMKYICWNFTRATGKAKSPCLLYLLRPEGKTGFSELARQVTTWAGNCSVNRQGTTAFICFSLLTFIFQQAQRFCRNSPCGIHGCVFSSCFITVQELANIQVSEETSVFLYWSHFCTLTFFLSGKDPGLSFFPCFVFLFKCVENWLN